MRLLAARGGIVGANQQAAVFDARFVGRDAVLLEARLPLSRRMVELPVVPGADDIDRR